jgi:predicted Fe-S protein YdhL (DUF1289 family)
MTVASPCISICSINETTGLCTGCFRTVEEVAGWLYFNEFQKTQILDMLKARKLTLPLAD